jgi:hypothetical protein
VPPPCPYIHTVRYMFGDWFEAAQKSPESESSHWALVGGFRNPAPPSPLACLLLLGESASSQHSFYSVVFLLTLDLVESTVIGPRRCCTTLALAHLFHDALQLAQDSFDFPKLFGMGIGYGARHPCVCSLPFFFFFFFF